MKPSMGCKLFGAHQALSGIQDTVILLHSVTGCNFGSLSFRLPGNMAGVRQACTVISDEDVVFGGEVSLERALASVAELYHPRAIFVLSGCVSEMTGEDIPGAVRRVQAEMPVFHLSAAGFHDNFTAGYEQALALLAQVMKEPKSAQEVPLVNLLGLGSDDYRVAQDAAAFQELLGQKARLGTVFSHCSWEAILTASQASLNLVLGRGTSLAKEMQTRFGIPYEVIDYPYGAGGFQEVSACLTKRLGISAEPVPSRLISRKLEPAYAYLQALYGMPAAVIGSSARARGMRCFLEEELGMEVTAFALREELITLDDFYKDARRSEAAILFGSSYEQELADELAIPLIRFDYPVIDEICISNSPFIGTMGTVCLIEEIINGIMRARKLKGALYQ